MNKTAKCRSSRDVLKGGGIQTVALVPLRAAACCACAFEGTLHERFMSLPASIYSPLLFSSQEGTFITGAFLHYSNR